MQTKPIRLAWVIDDDPLHALVLNRMLGLSQSVQSNRFFSGARAAIEALSEGKTDRESLPDLIFLDMVMSKGDGWEFLDFFKKAKTKFSLNSKVIVVSAIHPGDAQKLASYDVTEFISKPIDKKRFDELIEKMASIMMGPSS